LPNADDLTVGHDRHGRGTPRLPLWAALVLVVAGLAVAVLIMLRVAGPLYSLLFPPEVPVPDNAQIVEHVKPENGPEYWVYRTDMPGEGVAAFYERQGSVCRRSPQPDHTSDSSLPSSGPYSVATCVGEKETAGLGVSWEVLIHEGYSEVEGPTIFRVYKYGEVN